MRAPQITAIPIFENNYVWVIRPDPSQPDVYLVDPGEAAPVLSYLTNHQLLPKAILVTHRHRDHIDGIEDITRRWSIPVYGPDSAAIPQVTHALKEGDVVLLDKLAFHVMAVPGHTSEHIAYFLPDSTQYTPKATPMVFCGDALFAGGCGRMFDGPADLMWDSLCKLAALPDNTLIYCTHEYTLANLEFAVAVEPDNSAIRERLKQTKVLREEAKITLPSNILMEKRTNPFLRCHLDGVRNFACPEGINNCSPVQVFASLRTLKDNRAS
uniref:hydroxyacylglutathione hydrolase n=1 Tax=Cellvibrio fontiphilus TaxID=1815559 RepID=UPI002B4BB964|nr:hydroxyacylglutathione hydrolase [Cellvibrio fontiphilus]